MASSLFNGERAVVILFISRILYSTHFSLFFQALSFSLLSLFALFVDISLESSNSLSLFKTRPGASSGILLGAVTLPGLALLRLIQLDRALSMREVGVEEVEFLQLQYWVTSASCFSVLVFLCFISCHIAYNTNSVYSRSVGKIKFGISCIALYVAVCCLFFAEQSHSGWYKALTLLWVLCHGLAAVKLIQHVLHTFPECASIGEALLVTAGFVIYFGDMFACTVVKIDKYISSSGLNSVAYGVERSKISTIIQGMLLGLLLSPMFFKFILHTWEYYTSSADSEVRGHHEMRRSVIFYASLALILFVLVPSWMQFVQDFPVHPFYGYLILFSLNHSKGFHYVYTGWLLYLHQYCVSTTFPKTVRLREFFFENTTI